jgi:hypothetical protein
VVGSAEGQLELYLIWERSVAAYQRVTASEAGQAFHLSGELPAGAGARGSAQVDLVNGASVWYTVGHELTGATGPPGA